MSEELGPEARALIRGAIAQESSLGAPRRARLKRSVLAKAMLIAPEAAQAAALTGSKSAVSSALSAGKLAILAAKGAGAGLLVAATVHGVVKFVPSQKAPSAAENGRALAVHTAPARAARTDIENGKLVRAPEPPPAPSQAVPFSAVSPGVTREPLAPSGAPAPSLSAELLLMAEVQRALRDGQAGRALELVDRHAAAFPEGQLVNERLAAEAFAACRSGDVARARRAAARFLERDATSSLAARVKKTCPLEAR